MLVFVDRDNCRDKGCCSWPLPSATPALACDELPPAVPPPVPHTEEKPEVDLAELVCWVGARLTTSLALASDASANDRGVNGLCPSPPPLAPPPPPPATELPPEALPLAAIPPAADRAWPALCEVLVAAEEEAAGWARKGCPIPLSRC